MTVGLSHFNYWAVILIMMVGLYIVITHPNLMKKIMGFNVMQSAIFLFYINVGVVKGGSVPIIAPGFVDYSNPLPQVLMLTAIVVGVAATALALALVVRIQKAYGSIEEDDLIQMDRQAIQDEPV